MASKKFINVLSKAAIVAMFATAVAPIANAAERDVYDLSTHKVVYKYSDYSRNIKLQREIAARMAMGSSKYGYELSNKVYKMDDVNQQYLANNKNVSKTFESVKSNKTSVFAVNDVKEGLKVESVSAINAKQIAVEFSKPVTYESASNLNNYVFTKNDDKYGEDYTNKATDLLDTNNVKLFSNGKKVIFTLKEGKELDNGDRFGVDVKNSIMGIDGENVEAYGDIQRKFNDQEPPKINSVKLEGTNLKIYYNEPISTVNTENTKNTDFGVNIDGKKIETSKVKVETNFITEKTDSKNIIEGIEYVLNIDLKEDSLKDLLKKGDHEVVIYNMRDIVSRNGNGGNRVQLDKTNYTVTEDASVNLELKSIEPLDFNSLKVDFNKAPKKAKVTVYHGTTKYYEKVLDNSNVSQSNTIDLPYTVLSKQDGLTCLYDENATTTDVKVIVEDYEDDNRIVGKKVEKTITLKRENGKPAPSEKNTVAVTLDNNDNIISDITLKIPLIKGIGTAEKFDLKDPSKVRVIDAEGVERTLESSKIENNALEITVKNENGTRQKINKINPFTVIVEKGALEVESDKIDVQSPKTSDGNTNWEPQKFTNKLVNDRFETVAKYNKVTSDEDDSKFKYIEAVESAEVNNNVIKVTYKETMNAKSATNVNNYKIDGKALPEGTRITMDASSKVASIVLPKGSIEKTHEARLMISLNVETVLGSKVVGNVNTKEAYMTDKNIELTDNVAPVVKESIFLVDDKDKKTSKTLELVFSEPIKEKSVKDFSGTLEFVAKNSSTPISVSKVELKQNSNKEDVILVVTLKDEVNVSNGGILRIKKDASEENLLTDASENKLAKDTAVNVLGKKVDKSVTEVTQGLQEKAGH